MQDVRKQVPYVLVVHHVHSADKAHIKDPVHQIILVAEMIIKAFPVNSTVIADIRYADFLKWPLAHQLLHRCRQCIFRCIGI